MRQIAEGKTKQIFDVGAGIVQIRSKDDITAGDGARRDLLTGKAVLATATNGHVYSLLNDAGVATHYLGQDDETTFRAYHCDMVPIEVVSRRIATGSYLKRNPEIAEGHRFVPLLTEFFFKDDANHDPQISEEDIVKDKHLTEAELSGVKRQAALVFEVLERAWALEGVTLVDMKIEFGRRKSDGALLLADVIDNDSWRIWPGGDKSAMKDKQVYRNLTSRTEEALEKVLDNYRWVALKTETFARSGQGLAVVVMGSASDEKIGRAVADTLRALAVETHLRVCSAHKDPARLLDMAADYDALARPLVYVAIAGRSNGLGPVLDGTTPHPVINCPPPSDKFGGMDILSSLRLPGGLACSTVLEPETAALAVVKILAEQDAALWGRLRIYQRKTREAVAAADEKTRAVLPPSLAPAAAVRVPEPAHA